MEKKLLLLGVLRGHDMHGYQLNELLANNVGLSIRLNKSNAYKLLGKMAEDGWVTYHEEREGNRPPRRVYAVAPAGEAAFQQMLRDSLAAFPTPEFPGAVALNFLDTLPSDEAAVLLRQRRQKVGSHQEKLNEIPEDVRQAHPGMDYLHRYYIMELEWLDEVIGRLDEPEIA